MKCLLITLLLVISTTCQAQIYKWVDQDGHVHYSHAAPQNRSTQEIKIRTSPIDRTTQERVKKLNNDLNERHIDRRQTREEGVEAVQQRKKVASFCKKAKSQVTLLNSGASVSARKVDGTLVNVSAEDSVARLQKLNSHVSRFCHS